MRVLFAMRNRVSVLGRSISGQIEDKFMFMKTAVNERLEVSHLSPYTREFAYVRCMFEDSREVVFVDTPHSLILMLARPVYQQGGRKEKYRRVDTRLTVPKE